MHSERLAAVLNELNSSSADIEASAIISTDGSIMTALLPSGLDEDRFGAMSAAMLALGDRIIGELTRGDLEQVLIKASKGYLVLSHAGVDAVLTVLVKSNAKLSLIFLDAKRAAESISKIK